MIKLQNEKEKLLTTNWHNAVVVVSGVTLLPPLYEPWRHVIPTTLRTLASRYSHHSTSPYVRLSVMSPPSVDNPKQWRRRVYRFWRLTLSAGGAQWPPRGQGSIRINSRTQQKPHLRKTQICCSHDTIFGVNKLQELKYIKLQVCITVHQTAALYYSTSNCRAALQYTKLQP